MLFLLLPRFWWAGTQLCVYSHLFVLSRFQAPHMDRCFPFHSSEMELDGKLAAFRKRFVAISGAWRYCCLCYGFIMFTQPLLYVISTSLTLLFHFFLSLHLSVAFWQFVLSSLDCRRLQIRLSLLLLSFNFFLFLLLPVLLLLLRTTLTFRLMRWKVLLCFKLLS